MAFTFFEVRQVFRATCIWFFISQLISPVTAETTALSTGSYCGNRDFDDLGHPEHQEAVCLVKLSNLASRSEKTLLLKLVSGASKTFKSSGKEACAADGGADTCVNYFLIGYHSSAHLFLILVWGYENHEVLLVNAIDGTESKLASVPHFSPDGSIFIVIDNDITIREFDFAIGSLKGNRPALLWKRNSKDDYESWDFERWLDEHRIALKAGNDEICPKGNCESILTQIGKEWTLKVQPKQ
jgi:hypothetical protein